MQTRPARRDRKSEIADAAAALFAEVGYHRVGIDDIAESVGLTGGALYRHFANKAELLARVLFVRLDQLDGVVAGVSPGQADEGLEALVEGLAELALHDRAFGILLQREARNLLPQDRLVLVRRLDAATDGVARLIGAVRGELGDQDAWLLARSLLSAMASVSYHTLPVVRPATEMALRAAAMAIVRSGAVPTRVPATPESWVRRRATTGLARRVSRREMLVDASIRLFGRHGFCAVRMEDIGAAAAIAGPSIYEHFSGKADLLVAALGRGAEWLQLGLSRALAESATPGDALARVATSYVRFVLEHPDLMSLLLTEAVYLPDAERHALRRTEHDYVAEWGALLVQARPELSEREALWLVHTVFSVVNEVARRGRIRGRPDAAGVLQALSFDILGLAPGPAVDSKSKL